MGEITRKGFIKGITGGLVFRELNGKQIIQSRATKRAKNSNTTACSNEFKLVSESSKKIRQPIQSFLEERHDTKMYQRFTSALSKILQQNLDLPKGKRNLYNSRLSSLEGFEFNINKAFKEVFLNSLTTAVNDQREVQITIASFCPNKQVVFPANCQEANLSFYACFLEEQSQEIIEFPSNILSYKFKNTKDTNELLTFSFQAPSTCGAIFLTAQVQFTTTDSSSKIKTLYNNKLYNPAMLIFAKTFKDENPSIE